MKQLRKLPPLKRKIWQTNHRAKRRLRAKPTQATIVEGSAQDLVEHHRATAKQTLPSYIQATIERTWRSPKPLGEVRQRHGQALCA